MATHTKVVPQNKLYNYLAEQSMVLRDSEIIITSKSTHSKGVGSSNGENSIDPVSQDNSQIISRSGM